MKSPQVICITGMHRSGTSLAASWMEGCGLKLHDGSVWGSGPGNPKGHFEDKDFVALHDSAIKNENSASKGWIIFPQKAMFFKSKEHISKASKLVEIRSEKYNTWGWKDPRTSLFLEHWKKIFPSLKVIMLWRPCAEVIDSLIRRSKQTNFPVMKIGLIQSLRLWKSYNMLLLEYKENHPRDTLLFSLKNIVDSDLKIMNRINLEFQTEFEYTPIDTIYDRKLLSHDKVSNYHRILGRYFGSLWIEKKLADFSEQLERI